MRLRRKVLWGKVDAKGELKINMDDLRNFCRMHPNRSVAVRVEVQGIEPTERLKNYWFGYVVKEMQRAMYEGGNDLTEEQTYNEIRRSCPLFVEEKYEGSWKKRLKEWGELDKAEVVEIVAWTQRWASENFNWVIDDPKQ